MKMWAGRFSKEVDDRVNDFNSSIRFDCRMYEQDIKGSLAHAAMLAAQGIIPQEDADAIAQGLEGILADLKSGALVFDPGAEDIHMFVEAELTKRIGGAGKRLHTARSRNDQVALDLRLTLREEAKEIKALLLALISELRDRAAEHLDTVMPRLHPFAAGAAGDLRPPPGGLRQHVFARRGAGVRRGGADGILSARLGCARRDDLPDRPAADGGGARLYGPDGQLARRGVRPGLLHRAGERDRGHHDAPVALFGGDRGVVLVGIQVYRA